MANLFHDLTLETVATFSPCRTYRYQLWRRWGPGDYGHGLWL